MKNICKKILFIIVLIGIVGLFLFPINSRADDTTAGDDFLAEIKKGADFINDTESDSDIDIDASSIITLILAIAQILWFVGGVVLIIGTIYLGTQYGKASAENKAKAKKKLVEWVIVAVIIIGAYPIWNMLVNMFESF